MPKRITFQFEDDLDYQMQAIHSTIELFISYKPETAELLEERNTLF